ncbi:hypothetical protein HYX16_06505 [Candidatus Woesearchaeota archaeon]|nr:hypothetical protein [Candidatus Woesearchaeota archaeon]
MMNKRVLFYLISVLILAGLFAIYVMSEGEKVTAAFTIVSSNGLTTKNITTGANLNITCQGLFNTSLEGGSNFLTVYNLSLYHNLNGSGPSGGLGLNISNSSTPFINLVNSTASGTNMTATFVVYQNTTLTFNANGALTGTVSPLTDGNYTFGCLAGINVTNATYAGAAFQKNWAPNISIAIDRVRPTFSLLNITDGTKTVLQASLNGTSTLAANAYFTNNTNLTFRVTVTEPFIDTVKVYWTTNNTPVSLNDFRTRLNPNNLTLNKLISASASQNNSVFNGSFLVAGGSDEGIVSLALLADGATVNFMLVANDTAGNINNFSNNGIGFNITIDGKTPNFNLSSNSLLNVTDGTTTLKLNELNGTLQGSPVYLKNDSSLNFRVTITEPNVDVVLLFWSSNGTPVTLNEHKTRNNPRNLTLNKIVNQSAANGNNSVWNGSFLFAGDGTNTVTYPDSVVINFMLVVNDTAGNIKNLTNGGAGFNFSLDGSAPQITFTLDKSRIETFGKVKATCVANDTSPTGYTITLAQPNGGLVEKKSADGKAEFTGQETGQAGTYSVSCKAEDSISVGASSVRTFTAYYAGDDISYVGGDGEEEKVAEVDLSKEVVPGELPASIIGGIEGESATFTLDGVTSHRLTFLDIGQQEATIRIESVPVDVTLKLGESKEVDIDKDGTSDILLTLNSIADGKAQITVKTLEIKAPPVLESESLSIPSVAGSSLTGITVAVVLIVAGLFVAYFLLNKGKVKKK